MEVITLDGEEAHSTVPVNCSSINPRKVSYRAGIAEIIKVLTLLDSLPVLRNSVKIMPIR